MCDQAMPYIPLPTNWPDSVRPTVRRARTLVAAVNRSLKAHGESVDELVPSPAAFDDQDTPAVG